MNLVYRVCRCDAMKRLTLGVSILVVFFGNSLSALAEEPRFVDHSLLIASEYPATWPSAPFPRFQITHQRTIGPESAYNIDVLLIDGNTGTQLDVPPHSVARPELNREKSGPLGLAYTDKIEPWQFGGEACVVDVRDLLDIASKGVSPARAATSSRLSRPSSGMRMVGRGFNRKTGRRRSIGRRGAMGIGANLPSPASVRSIMTRR